MDPQHLHELLAQLHAELASGEGLDENNRRLLQAVHDDIERIAVPGSGGHEQVRGRLREAVANFQASHPQLATNLESTMNALSNMGL